MTALKACAAGAMLLAAGAARAVEILEVPTEPQAEYRVLSVTPSPEKGMVEIVTRRESGAGVSFSKRLVDCGRWRFKYLAEGKTLEDLEAEQPSSWSDLVEQSASWFVFQRACAR